MKYSESDKLDAGERLFRDAFIETFGQTEYMTPTERAIYDKGGMSALRAYWKRERAVKVLKWNLKAIVIAIIGVPLVFLAQFLWMWYWH